MSATRAHSYKELFLEHPDPLPSPSNKTPPWFLVHRSGGSTAGVALGVRAGGDGDLGRSLFQWDHTAHCTASMVKIYVVGEAVRIKLFPMILLFYVDLRYWDLISVSLLVLWGIEVFFLYLFWFLKLRFRVECVVYFEEEVCARVVSLWMIVVLEFVWGLGGSVAFGIDPTCSWHT